MKILFLHGWKSVVGGVKPTYLQTAGHQVANPKLDDEDFELALQTATTSLADQQPDVIVGSSRGGAIAMNLFASGVPLVLLCPAWKNWGIVKRVPGNTVILHSRNDEVIPFTDSEELIHNSNLTPESLIEVGNDHRLADEESLQTMLLACERLV